MGRLTVVSRSDVRAAALAAPLDAMPLRVDDLPAALADADLLVTATGSATPVVLAEQVRSARLGAHHRSPDPPQGPAPADDQGQGAVR